ncbi:MAG: outer membrane beta-barrel protein [Alistipes sp.]|nr:outer membrane beta-barrel protein [Alistipes sp.]
MCVLAVAPAMAQSAKVTGKIIDKDSRQGVVGAIVEFVSEDDRHRHTTSGADGVISYGSLPYGTHRIYVTFIGYATYTDTIEVRGNVDLGTIELATEAVKIDAVVKEVHVMRTSQKGDTVAYNASAFKVATDANVDGLLKKMPGITITNGTVEAQGEQVKKIFVDGKEFFGEDVSTAISSLPAQAVDRIEVFNKLSDNAEFSGMDDGEGYKAINIVTHSNMRQGIFGKVYGGYGYQPDAEGITSNHKYNAGGNINIFNNSSRISVIGLLNNVNQQNFSFEDILGVTGGGGGMGGGRGRGVGQYMVRPQSGVARVGSIGLQYSDAWGKNDAVKLNGSYFFNSSRTKNNSRLEKWYESPSPVDTLEQSGYSNTLNMNHRLNVRLDWAINKNMSLMSRTNFSFQGNDPYSTVDGMQWGESGVNIIESGTNGKSRALRFSEFLSYRAKLGKDGRTITVDGRYSMRRTPRSWTHSYSTLDTSFDETTGIYSPNLRFVSSFAPQKENDVSANFTYTEPVAKYLQLSLQYRFDYEDQWIDKLSYITADDSYNIDGLKPNSDLSSTTDSRYIEHKVGPGLRFAKERNSIVANIFYQNSTLKGLVDEDRINRIYHDVTYFVMGNFAFNPQNTLRVFLMSHSENPDVRNLQSIYDVSNAQYISRGNPDLDPAYTHRLNMHYVRSNVEKGRTFMWMIYAQYTQDYIGQSVIFNPTDKDMPGLSDAGNYKPLQFNTYDNMDGFVMLRTHVNYGFPISPIKCNLNLMAGVSWTRTPSMINNEVTYTSNMGYDAMLSLGSNISENIDFTIQWNGTFNDATQNMANMRGVRNQYFSHVASGTLKWVFWKGFTLTAAVNYNQYVGFTNNYNEDYLICNVYLGKKLFKNQLGEVLIGVNDLLNQNTAFARTVGSGYTQNAWNSVIGRYFTVQFNYNLRYFGKNATRDISKYEGMSPTHGNAFGRPPMHR